MIARQPVLLGVPHEDGNNRAWEIEQLKLKKQI
jgi:hypothetical protein